MVGSLPNLHTMDSRSACIQGVLKVKAKGHVIRALSWILGMSYSVIDGLVELCVYCHIHMVVFCSTTPMFPELLWVRSALKTKLLRVVVPVLFTGYMAVKWHSAVTTVTIGNDSCFAGRVMLCCTICLHCRRRCNCFAANFKHKYDEEVWADTKLRVQDVKINRHFGSA